MGKISPVSVGFSGLFGQSPSTVARNTGFRAFFFVEARLQGAVEEIVAHKPVEFLLGIEVMVSAQEVKP